MKTGVILPGGTAAEQLEQAVLAEKAGWDGVFVWEAPYGVDAWTLLGAAAARTTRVKLGTLLTPLPARGQVDAPRPPLRRDRAAVPRRRARGDARRRRRVRAWLAEHGARDDFDVVAQSETPARDPAAAGAKVAPWAAAGCTWWLGTRWELPHHVPERLEQVRERIAAGPPPAG